MFIRGLSKGQTKRLVTLPEPKVFALPFQVSHACTTETYYADSFVLIHVYACIY